jgi:hypothetical protein
MVDAQLPEKALTLLSFSYFTTSCTVLFTLVYLLLSSQLMKNNYVFIKLALDLKTISKYIQVKVIRGIKTITNQLHRGFDIFTFENYLHKI